MTVDRQGCGWGAAITAASMLFGCAVSIAAWPSPAAAQDACATFKWPVTVEQALLRGGKTEVGATGRLATLPVQALDLALVAPDRVTFAVQPKRPPKPDSGNAVIAIDAIGAAGQYQVTLSDDAWVDIVQAGAGAATVDFSGVHGCAGIRKSVRFDVKAGPAILQISGSSVQRLSVVIRRLE